MILIGYKFYFDNFNAHAQKSHMRKMYLLVALAIFACCTTVLAQVSVTATAGTPGPTTYATVNAAFGAINDGTHQGDVTITISSNTSEPATPIPLLGSGTGTSNYTSVLIRPQGNVTVNSAATPTATRALIELHGADFVTINGDDPSTTGPRNLTFQVAVSANTLGVISLGSKSTAGSDGATNITIKNTNIIGSRNSATTTTTSYGIVFSNNASVNTISAGSYANDLVTIENNDIRRTLHGINAQGNATYVNNNLVIRNNLIGSATSADNIGTRGILIAGTAVAAGPSSVIIEGNDIRVGDYSTTGLETNIAGVEVAANNAGAIITRNNIHDVYNQSVGGWGAWGIAFTSATNNSGISVTNNFIRDMVASRYSSTLTTTWQNYGIFISAAVTGLDLIHNTIVMSQPNTTGGTANYVSAALNVNAAATFNQIANNIFVHTAGNTTNGYAFGAFNSAGATNLASAIIDNNSYYVSGSGKVGYGGGSAKATLADWQAYTTKDAASLFFNPPFISSTNLHISTTNPTPLESAGMTTVITVDIDSQSRPGPVPSVNGGGIAPDIGADEFDGMLLPANDAAASAFVNPMANGSVSAGIGFTPQASFSNVGSSDQGSIATRFRILNASTMAVVYDQTATAAINAQQSQTVDFPTATLTPGQYIMQAIAQLTGDINTGNDTIAANLTALAPLCGNYLVGASEPSPYNTLTGAINALKSAGMSCAVTFTLTDTAYTTAEVFPIVLTEVTGASDINTLTIRPASGVNTVVRGSASSLLKLEGADYVTIDGSNNGTGTRNLTFTNNSAAGSTAIWIASVGSGNGATYNTIKNTNIIGGSGSATGVYGVVSSASTSLTTGAEDNDYITIQNNHISRAYNGISVIGTVLAPADSLKIIDNMIGHDSASHQIQNRGIEINRANYPIISRNKIFNIITTGFINNAGIDIGADVIGGEITRNNITAILSLNTGGYGAYGINFSSGTGTTGLLIANNFISDVRTVNYSTTTTTWNAFGIRFTGGTGHKVYHNSINMFGNVTTGGSAGMSANMLITSSSVTGLDVRNNIFSNTQVFGVAGSYAYNIYQVSGVTYGTIDFNDYWGMDGTNTTYRVGYDGTARTTLSDWQMATLQDASSLNVEPVFTSPTNLHQAAVSLNDVATSLPEVTDDYDGETRSATPDIGADEFTPAATDIAASALLSPINCESSATPVTVTIKNNGLNAINLATNNVTVGGSVTGPAPETFATIVLNSGIINAGETLDVIIDTTYNMSAAGNYTFTTYAKMAGDGNIPNDTLVVTRTITPSMPFPYTQDFNASTSVPAGWNTPGWTIGAGGHGNGGNGLYINLYSSNQSGNFSMPKLGPVPASTVLNFDYRLVNWSGYPATFTPNSPDWGSITILRSTDCGVTWVPFDIIDPSNHTAGLAWTTKTLSLDSFVNQSVMFKFEADWNNGDYYIDIDNFNSVTLVGDDIAVDALVSPINCEAASTPVVVRIKNAGTNVINMGVTNVTVSGSVSGPNPATFTPVVISTGILNPGDTMEVTIASNYNMSAPGSYVFTSIAKMTGDGFIPNDTNYTTRTISSPMAVPYTQGFDASTALPAGWSSSGFAVNTTHGQSGNGLTYNFYSSAQAAAFTLPKLGPITAGMTLDFDYRLVDWSSYPTTPTPNSPSWGSITILRSTDCGVTWVPFDIIDPNNHVTSMAWATKSLPLDSFVGQTVMFKFDGVWTGGDYYADFDNFSILSPCTAPPVGGDVTTTSTSVCSGATFTLNVTGATVGSGTTYDWESSTDGIAFSSTGIATENLTVTGGITSNTWYRRAITCSGITSYSDTMALTIKPSTQCYCSPTNTGTQLHNGTTPTINNVSITGTTLNNSNAGTPASGYTMFGATGSATGDLAQGSTYTLSVNIVGGNAIGSVWIDYDQNGTFDAGEHTQIVTNATGVQTVSVAVPATATLGLTGMRVRLRGAFNANGPMDACTLFGSGETEDYFVTITSNLPVSITSFKGERMASGNLLTWITANEVNNAGFELERSADATQFASIAKIATKAEGGNSNAELTYNYLDANPLKGDAYYRLKQLDKDGKVSYSTVVLLKADKVSRIEIAGLYPNPATERLNLKLTAPEASRINVQITDITGRIMQTREVMVNAGNNLIDFNIASFTSGIYTIKVTGLDGETNLVKKFVKQ